jgi:hypothetical protein
MVLAKNYRGPERWKVGKILERIGRVKYKGDVDGYEWMRHTNQLRTYHVNDEDETGDFIFPNKNQQQRQLDETEAMIEQQSEVDDSKALFILSSCRDASYDRTINAIVRQVVRRVVRHIVRCVVRHVVRRVVRCVVRRVIRRVVRHKNAPSCRDTTEL